MHCIVFVVLLIVLVALALVGQCDIHHAAGQVLHVTQTSQFHTRVDAVKPPNVAPASIDPVGSWSPQKGGDAHGLETDQVSDRRRD